MSELEDYLENILDSDEIIQALKCANIDESFECEKNRLHIKSLERQLEANRKAYREIEQVKVDLRTEIARLQGLLDLERQWTKNTQGVLTTFASALSKRNAEKANLIEWLDQEKQDWGSSKKDTWNPYCRVLSKLKEKGE